MKRKIAVIALVVLVATGITTASSFTTATLSRDTSINVVNDAQGVIALGDELPGDVIRQDSSSGELKIDFTVGSASGVNVDSVYELGDPANPVSTAGFNVTNNDQTGHSVTLNYSVTSGDGTANAYNETEFQVYRSDGTPITTVSEEDNGASFSLTSGETVYVVVIVDTTDGGIDQNDDLSGTLEVSAT